jgi:hypothetical protein
MATRTIVTSQPDVACDVCQRRLLRGEQTDIFLGAGQRYTVCELCAPRATHEGWLRETDDQAVSLAPLRPRRGRNLFDRLRQVGKPAGREADAAGADSSPEADLQPVPYDFLEGDSGVADPPGGQPPASAALAPVQLEHTPVVGGGRAERAIAIFNAGGHPRRVAGVARSLGAPEVSVRPDKDIHSLVSIVVAWELCWYRYQVDIEDQDAEATVLAQGTELEELPREDRRANAVAGEAGKLSLAGA